MTASKFYESIILIKDNLKMHLKGNYKNENPIFVDKLQFIFSLNFFLQDRLIKLTD